MERTVSVNLGGKALVFDESAYIALKNYFNEIEARLEPSECTKTIAEIEERMAEIFKTNMCHGTEIVSLNIVNNAISIVGASTSFGSASKTPKSDNMKRIYRNTDNAIFGGVCSGLSEYLNVDLIVVRILAFMLVFFMGLSLWVYIIMWLFIPPKPTLY